MAPSVDTASRAFAMRANSDAENDAETAGLGVGVVAASEARARSKTWWLGLALAQLCALVNAISAAASTALERSNVTLPAWQTFLAYAFIGATFGPMFYARVRGGRAPEYDSGRLGKYAACAFVDVQANYCVTLAFRYTSMTSVSLLDSATIPFAMLLSTLLLKARYGRAHAGGAAVAFVGVVILVFGDLRSTEDGETGGMGNRTLGDFLAILAAALYATSNVLVEAFLHDADKVEILAHLGVMGFLFSGVQGAILEGLRFSQLRALGTQGVGYFFLYAASLFTLYTFAMDVLSACGASAFNVSMLASDVWSVILRLFFFEGFASVGAVVAFVFAFVLVACGICIFAYAGDPSTVDTPVASTSDESDVSLLARIRRFVAPRAETTPYVAMDASRRDVELTPVPISP